MATVPRARVLLWVALAAYSFGLAIALLAPTSGTQSEMAGWLRDLGRDVGVSRYRATQANAEFIANVLILAPISALGSLLWLRTTWSGWTAYTFALACGVELFQGLVLPDRTPSAVDVVANTLGGLLGAVVIAAVREALVRLAARRATHRAPAGQVSASHREERPGLG